LCDGGRHGGVDITDVLRNRPRVERRLFEIARDLFRVELGVRPVVPFDHQGRQPLLRTPISSATTAMASSSRTIWRTPLMAFAAVSSTRFTRPPKTGDCTRFAIFTPGGRTSIPKTAAPLTFAGVSRRLAGVPISLKSCGRL